MYPNILTISRYGGWYLAWGCIHGGTMWCTNILTERTNILSVWGCVLYGTLASRGTNISSALSMVPSIYPYIPHISSPLLRVSWSLGSGGLRVCTVGSMLWRVGSLRKLVGIPNVARVGRRYCTHLLRRYDTYHYTPNIHPIKGPPVGYY